MNESSISDAANDYDKKKKVPNNNNNIMFSPHGRAKRASVGRAADFRRGLSRPNRAVKRSRPHTT